MLQLDPAGFATLPRPKIDRWHRVQSNLDKADLQEIPVAHSDNSVGDSPVYQKTVVILDTATLILEEVSKGTNFLSKSPWAG